MPLPLLAFAAAAGTKIVASYTAAQLAIAGGVGVGVGGITVGGVWYFLTNNEKLLLEEHVKLLDAQHNITVKCIENAELMMKALSQNIGVLSQAIDTDTSSMTLSVNILQLLVSQLISSTDNVGEALKLLECSNDQFTKSVQTFTKLLIHFNKKQEKISKNTEALTALMNTKQTDLSTVLGDFRSLVESAKSATGRIDDLAELVKKLTEKNIEQQKIITSKDGEIKELQTLCKRFYKQACFFKEKVLDAKKSAQEEDIAPQMEMK